MVAVQIVNDLAAPTERLEAEACTLAAAIAASTCRFLLVVAELDRRESWREWGCKSMAHWLSWRCATALPTAREQVRVGRALAELPRTTEAFAAGKLSYSKARALVRIATAASEAELVDLASMTTAAQLERIVTAYVGSTRDAVTSQLARRRLTVRHEDDGGVTIVARLPREAAELVLTALDTAISAVPHDAAAPDTDDPLAARRADALELIARSYVQPDGAQAPRGDVVVHADLDLLCDESGGRAATLRRLACDARLSLHVDDRGKTIDVGRRRRTVPPALRLAIERRDGGRCRFPSCTNRRYVHVHHLVHWAHGGATDQDNLILLCSSHHRLLHEGGWRVRGDAGDHLVFVGPDDRRFGSVPPVTSADPVPTEGINDTTIATAFGTRLDLDHAVTALHGELDRSRE